MLNTNMHYEIKAMLKQLVNINYIAQNIYLQNFSTD